MSRASTPQLDTIAALAVDGANKRGVVDIRAIGSRARSVSVTYRKGRPEKVEESQERSLTVHLYLEGKYNISKTNDLREPALNRFLDSQVAFLKEMTPDTFRVMPDPSLYEGQRDLDLKLFDSRIHSVASDFRHNYAAALEKETLAAAEKVAVSCEASFQDVLSERYQIHSNGFEGRKKSTQFWSFSELSVKDKDDKRPSGWAQTGSRFRDRLVSPGEVGQKTAQNALARIGAEQIGTEKMPMVIENRAVSRLLGQLLGAVSGRSWQQKSSFLEGRLSQKIGSHLLTLIDDPFIPSGFGSRLFDSEGIAAKKMPIFENGVLRNGYIDTYYGNKLGMEPTTGARSNLVMPPSDKSLADLVAGIDKGVLVRGFLGGNTNPTTGDFSLGVYGTLIEKGLLTRPVSEMNISGTHIDLWNRLQVVGNDPYSYSTLKVPSLLFDNIQFAGA